MRDIAHLFRPATCSSCATSSTTPRPRQRPLRRLELLKNANVSAGGVLPMCQDTGTAIVMGKKGQQVWTGGGDEEAIAAACSTPTSETNLRYSQIAR
jgi:fumarate hydratase class I